MDVAHKFHPYTFSCPECRKPVPIGTVAFRADGKVHLDGKCPTPGCRAVGETVAWEADYTTILAECVVSDFTDAVTIN